MMMTRHFPDNKEWDNSVTTAVYNKPSRDFMTDLLSICELDENNDLEPLIPYIHENDFILELGAGNGRVIDFLLDNPTQTYITAVENSPYYLDILRTKYKQLIAIRDADILNINSNTEEHTYDLILIMWGTITGFGKGEQQKIISNIYGLLNPGGVFMIDKPCILGKNFNMYIKKLEKFSRPSYDNKFNACVPTKNDLEKWAATAGFKKIDELPYVGTGGQERIINALVKK